MCLASPRYLRDGDDVPLEADISQAPRRTVVASSRNRRSQQVCSTTLRSCRSTSRRSIQSSTMIRSLVSKVASYVWSTRHPIFLNHESVCRAGRLPAKGRGRGKGDEVRGIGGKGRGRGEGEGEGIEFLSARTKSLGVLGRDFDELERAPRFMRLHAITCDRFGKQRRSSCHHVRRSRRESHGLHMRLAHGGVASVGNSQTLLGWNRAICHRNPSQSAPYPCRGWSTRTR